MDRAPRPQIERALRYIGEHLEQSITVADVARAVHLSEFHLHRVFHAEVGESIGRFITRRRLELAALRLAYEQDRSITEIALSSGYSSSSNFTKAFAQYYGCSPTQVRQPQPDMPPRVGKLLTQYGRDFRPEDLYALPDESDRRREAAVWEARVRFEESAGLTFACLAAPGGYETDTLLATWTELIARARQLGLCQGPVDAWGVAHDSPQLTATELLRYHACVPCPPSSGLPPPLFRGYMAAGRYAVFHYAGEVTGVADAYRGIYSCWFPESSVAPADFESHDHYIGDFPEAGQIELELWFRLRSRIAG